MPELRPAFNPLNKKKPALAGFFSLLIALTGKCTFTHSRQLFADWCVHITGVEAQANTKYGLGQRLASVQTFQPAGFGCQLIGAAWSIKVTNH